jgi:hypothetical protein
MLSAAEAAFVYSIAPAASYWIGLRDTGAGAAGAPPRHLPVFVSLA